MKKFLAKLLGVILCILIIIFCGCIALKPVSASLIKNLISQSNTQAKVISLIQKVYPNTSNDKISEIEDKLFENKDVENTLYSYLNYYTSIVSGNYVSESEINKSVSDLLNNNFDNIENELGLNLNSNQKEKMKSILSYGNDKAIEIIKQSAESTSNKLSPGEKKLLKVCSIVTSKDILKVLLGIIFLLVVLIILLQFKRKKWLENLSIVFIMAGIITGLILSIITKVVGNLVLGEIIGKSINVNVNMFFREGIMLFFIGILFIVIYKIANRKKKG